MDHDILRPDKLTMTPAAEATLAPAVDEGVAQDKGPFTFGDAFASGALPQGDTSTKTATISTLFGAGLVATASFDVASSAAYPSLIAPLELEPDGKSISMRTIPTDMASAPSATPNNP
jgi:hypothetical protein